jgi:ribosome-binding factor A
MPREFSRNQRLGNQVLRTLAELLQFEVKDPRVQGVAARSECRTSVFQFAGP